MLPALGGHGVPGVGFIPGEEVLPWVPAVEGLELDDPVLGVEPDAPFDVPGKGPQGPPFGVVPGVVEFGLVEGVVVPGAVLGVVVPGVPLGEVDPGVA